MEGSYEKENNFINIIYYSYYFINLFNVSFKFYKTSNVYK